MTCLRYLSASEIGCETKDDGDTRTLYNNKMFRKPINSSHVINTFIRRPIQGNTIQCQTETFIGFLLLCIAQYNTGYSVDIASPRIPKRRTRKQYPNQSVVPTSG